VASARAEFYPNISLVGFAGLSSMTLEHLVQAGSRVYGIGPALHLPLFDAGRLRANLHGRSADLDAAIAAYNGALFDAVREVADAGASAQSIARQQAEQAAAQADAESAYDFALQRYRAGLGPYLIVLAAENAVLAQRRLGTELRARQLDTQVALSRALGGGYAPDAADAPGAAPVGPQAAR
jgi:outer membrane protein TolC